MCDSSFGDGTKNRLEKADEEEENGMGAKRGWEEVMLAQKGLVWVCRI